MNRNEYNRSCTIEDIKLAFISLYEAHGIDKVTIREICEKANVSRTIFYKYFDDKYQVLETIEDELVEGVKTINLALPSTTLSGYVKGTPFPVFFETASYIYSKRAYFRPLLSKHGDPHFIYKWKKQCCADLYGKFRMDNIRADRLEVVMEMCASAIVGLYTYWFFECPEMSCEEVSAIGGNLLFGSFYNFRD